MRVQELLIVAPLFTAPTWGDINVENEVGLPLADADRDAIIAMATEIDPVAGGQIRQAVDSGDLGIGRLSQSPGNVGTHDKGTILVNRQYWSQGVCAVTLLHEWRHIDRIPEEAPEDEQDGDDNDPCDPCAHARNHGESHDDLITAFENGKMTAAELCKAINLNDSRGPKLWNECKYSGCASGDAFDDHPWSGLHHKPMPVDCPPPQ